MRKKRDVRSKRKILFILLGIVLVYCVADIFFKCNYARHNSPDGIRADIEKNWSVCIPSESEVAYRLKWSPDLGGRTVYTIFSFTEKPTDMLSKFFTGCDAEFEYSMTWSLSVLERKAKESVPDTYKFDWKSEYSWLSFENSERSDPGAYGQAYFLYSPSEKNLYIFEEFFD